MPIPWLFVLRNVPWAQVISNAPKVAEGAVKLWKSVARKEPAAASGGVRPASAVRSDAEPQPRIAELEARVSELHEQMVASSELIKALAEQNTQLVARIEANRVRAQRMAWAIVLIGAIAILSLARLVISPGA